MESEDLYPNNTEFWFPAEPKEQAIARKKEQAQTLEAIDTLNDVVKRIDERIDFFERHSNIPAEVRTDPKKFLIMSNSYTMTADNLRVEKEYIQSLIDSHKR